MEQYKRVLTIAGSDSGGCAGIQADIKTISACGCFTASAITAITAQNTVGIQAVHIPPAEIIEQQIIAVMEDIGADAIKTGMLPNEQIIEIVVHMLKRYGITNFVLDPVMVSTSGDELVSHKAIDMIVKQLMPLALLITPNIPEAEYITGMTIESETDFDNAAKELFKLGAQNILLKAGHLNSQTLSDYLYCYDGKVFMHTYRRLDTPNTHGTGCSLSAAIASFLAQGNNLPDAVALAEEYLHNALEHGSRYSIGKGHGPLHHFYKFWR